MKPTMQTAADNLNRQVKQMGDGWTWVRCEVGYVVHQGKLPYDERGDAGWGLGAYRNPIFIGKTCSVATAWTP